MTNSGMAASTKKSVGELPGDWTWERFTLVEAGNGQIAFHSSVFNRFVQVEGNARNEAHPHMARSGEKNASDLPGDWTWERFTPIDAGNGLIAFYSPVLSRFVRM